MIPNGSCADWGVDDRDSFSRLESDTYNIIGHLEGFDLQQKKNSQDFSKDYSQKLSWDFSQVYS